MREPTMEIEPRRRTTAWPEFRRLQAERPGESARTGAPEPSPGGLRAEVLYRFVAGADTEPEPMPDEDISRLAIRSRRYS
jgi:hypothetical protein